MVLCITEDYTCFYINEYDQPVVDLNVCDEYMTKYLKLETDEDLKKKKENEYNSFKKKLTETIKLRETEKKEEIEKITEMDKKIFSVVLKITAVIVVIIIAESLLTNLINSIQENKKEKQTNKEKSDIEITSFFNNSQEANYEKKEVRENNTLCYHFIFNSKDTQKKYNISFTTLINGVLKDKNEPFDDQFKNGDTGWVCWNLEKDEPLEVGKYEVQLVVEINEKNYVMDQKTIKVVSIDE